ncbi:hypothetical protein [Stenomitos frigidus]|uniref:hypothetical protein n=1 Tax=Stenomitos frigidus TaxID=1886765 RepID=UPI0015E6F9F9|nr:hypothetical protein [Stenomitos frigidus]
MSRKSSYNKTQAFNPPLVGKAIATPTHSVRSHSAKAFNPPLAKKAIATVHRLKPR